MFGASRPFGHPPDGAPTAKIVLLGESAVGKSSVAIRFARSEFSANQEVTVGAGFFSRSVTVAPPADGSVKFGIWDTAGQERYRSLAPIYYRGACGALVVYDITSADSLRRAQTWIRELRANADPTLIIFLLGNKKDLESLRQVSYEEGAELAKEENVSGFFETSAKDNYNIDEVFVAMARTLLEHGFANSPRGREGGALGAKSLESQTPPAKREQSGCSC